MAGNKIDDSKRKVWDATLETKEGKYWINIHDINGHIQVSFYFKDNEEALKNFAKEIGFQIDKRSKLSTTYHAIYQYMEKERVKTGYSFDLIGEDVLRSSYTYPNPMDGLKAVAKILKLKIDAKWDIQTAARFLIDSIAAKK